MGKPGRWRKEGKERKAVTSGELEREDWFRRNAEGEEEEKGRREATTPGEGARRGRGERGGEGGREKAGAGRLGH